MGKSYTNMTGDERTAAISSEIKGVFTDLTDVALGTTGLVVGTGLKILGGGVKLFKNGLHMAAGIAPVKNNATRIKGFLGNLVADPEENRVYTEEEIKAAEDLIKQMKSQKASK